MENTLVLFDFDGTLTKSDTFIRFITTMGYRRRWPMVVWNGILWLAGKKRSAASLKEAILAGMFQGVSLTELQIRGRLFCEMQLPGMLHPELVATMRSYKARGATVAIVSASIDVWLKPFTDQEGVGLLCTELEFDQGRFTGKFATPNCKYEEKVRRIQAKYPVSSYQAILAFGNSKGDEAMLKMANQSWKITRRGEIIPFRG
jgi:HAD superfamily hydrolase (TIGR01490 family)